MAFSDELPTDSRSLRLQAPNTTAGFLEWPAENFETECVHTLSEYDMHCNKYFWIAVPAASGDIDGYDIIPWDDRNFIEVVCNDGQTWELITDLQDLHSQTLREVGLGEQVRYYAEPTIKRDYTLYYINLRRNGPLGDGVKEIRVRVSSGNPSTGGSYLLTERSNRIAVDDYETPLTDVIILEN